MFLKRLDVVGFKSFAERIEVEFVPGVTAVVGPNGSGKSNISDAVRWVLGEQSAKSLRGSKMEDIIFAGSEARKPLNFAEVSLTLDNGDQYIPIDYNELSITRRVYRSGDSEYLINNQQCRLKDILELFMDSGLGRQAYSIIGQGKVEEILSSKPEDRRRIFEEAAGVLKYKSRKVKAEQKLQETEGNLNRVKDILHELEGQIEPLQIQASMAEDFLNKKSELESIESALLVYEIEQLHKEWEASSHQYQQLKADAVTYQAELNRKEAEVEKLRNELTTLDASIDELQAVLLSVSEALEKAEGKREVMRERKKNYHLNKEQLTHRITQQEEKKHTTEIMLRKEQDILTKNTTQISALRNELKDKESQLEVVDRNIEEELEQLKSEYFDCLNKETSNKNEIRYLSEQLNQHESKSSLLSNRHQQYIEQREAILKRKHTWTVKLTAVQNELDQYVTSFMTLKTEIERDESSFGERESKLYQAYQYLQQFRSKKELLQGMQEEYSGFFQGVREILKERRYKLEGIEGAVAELLSVKKEYETAIETALGAATQYIVVQTEDHARNAISFLKQKRMGRATFLPLTSIKNRRIASHDEVKLKAHPSFVGIASDLAMFAKKYRAIVENLLGNVLISRDLKGANALAKIVHHRFRIVTLQGDIVNTGGSMTGGSSKQKNTSLLSRQREIESVSEKVSTMEQQTKKLEEQVKQGKIALKNKKEQLEQMREQGEKTRIQEQQFKSELREIELEATNVNEHLSLYDREKGTFDTEKSSIERRVAALNEKRQVGEITAAELKRQIEQLTVQKKNQQTTKEDLIEEITSMKVNLAQCEQQHFNTNDTVQRLKKELKETLTVMKEAKAEDRLLEEAANTSSSDAASLDEKILQSRSDKAATNQLMGDRKKERREHQQTVDELERGYKEWKRGYKPLLESIHQTEIQLNRLDVDLKNRLDLLREEYQLSYEGAKEKYNLEISPEDARTKVTLIKRAIEELGAVNLGAIGEYERVSERYTFLNSQQNDLNHAKNTLYSIINEMDEEMTRRFKKSFFEIRNQFQTIFTQLFGGGSADLKLTEPSDLLHTGVEIFAQPPGKKLQQLALLSGGERALTAISLLFGILKVRPVPFCFFDEVEAALDEANVNRFAKFLRAFSAQTQFIVVTHRKGTMEEADVLYGVTMRESGVSNLVSVKLEESKQLVST